ncbi:MAG TPA: branched-chain amino acid ABC transporter permease [Candidatus Methylomirabilis sp.]|nr:branched-chain amino acid ABC transporter permease [Candidatus Methylomirabilis sp.]
MTFSVFIALFINGAVWGSVYSLVAMGLNLIYGVMKILNIAHGELVMIGAYFAFWLFTLWGINPLISAVLVVPLMFAMGVLIQWLVVNPIGRENSSTESIERASLVAFFGALLIFQNIALSLWGTEYRTVPYLTKPVQFSHFVISAARLVILGIGLVLPFLMSAFLHKSLTGKAIRAVSQDREVALFMGIDARRMGLLSFGIGSVFAGVGGVLASMMYLFTPVVGLSFTLKAFTVMVLGGPGNPLGALASGLAIGVAESLVSFHFGEGYRDVIGYLLLVLFVLVLYFMPRLKLRQEISDPRAKAR